MEEMGWKKGIENDERRKNFLRGSSQVLSVY